MNRNKGYTLMEILLVLALISIIFLMGVPSTRFFSYIKEDKELKEFKKDLLFSRNNAITEYKTYYIYLDYGNNGYYITKEGSTKIIKRKNFQYGIKLKKGNTLSYISFTSSGAPSSTGTLYLLNSRGEEYKLTVTPVTGKVNLTKIK